MKRSLLAACLAMVTIWCGAAFATADPAPAAPQNTAPLDLKTGKVDTTKVMDELRDGILYPLTPPQTVEGVLVSIDIAGQSAVVRTLRDGEVKIGLPEGIILSREGRSEGCSLNDLQPGDRVYATVVTAAGNRAIRLVSESPANPMVSYIGIPVLCVMALIIWRIRCKPLAGAAPATPAPKGA